MTASYDLGDEHFCSIKKREFPNHLGNYQINMYKICATDLFMLENSVKPKVLIIEIINHPVQQI
jgi:hypothetical protein